MASNIICLAVGRFDDQSIIADYIPNQTNRQLIHKEIYGLLSSKPEVE